MIASRPVLALGRHAETEATGTGASPGARFMFASLEAALQRDFTIVRLPPYYYRADARQALRIAIEMLAEVDACLFGLPTAPFDLDPFFLVRDRLNKRTPFVYMPLGEFPRGAWYYRHIHRRLREQDLVLFSCRADRAIHDALVASIPAQLAVVPWGIQVERFHTTAEQRAVTRRHLGLAEDEVVFVYHGRITAEKNVHALIALFRRLLRYYPGARLWIIGSVEDAEDDVLSAPSKRRADTSLSALLRGMLADELQANRAKFWGPLASAAVPRLLGAADVAVNLTVNGDESFGYGVVEAMAAGLPVIGTDWGGLKDTIEDGVTGVRVPTTITPIGVAIDHYHAFASARRLIDCREQRLAMGAAGRARARSEFSIDRFAASVTEHVMARLRSSVTDDESRPVWTALGRRFASVYSVRSDTPVGVVPRPVPASCTLFADHPLMRDVVRPYATGVRSSKVDRRGLFFLATEQLHVRGDTVRSRDPRYVFVYRLTNAVDRAVIAVLRTHAFCDRQTLATQLKRRFDDASIRAALRRLISAGIVVQSKNRDTWDRQASNVAGRQGDVGESSVNRFASGHR